MANKEDNGCGVVVCLAGVIIISLLLTHFDTCSKKKKETEKEQALVQDSLALVIDGYTASALENGEILNCESKNKVSIKNTLRVICHSSRNAIIKLINTETQKCVICFYVSGNSEYTANNIPAGNYLLKIAKGKIWMTKDNETCYGKFFRNVEYDIPADTLKYYDYMYLGQEINLDVLGYKGVYPSVFEKSLETSNGTEKDFNK